MSNDFRPPLSRPFSRPTHAEGLPAVSPQPGITPARRTPYMGIPIPDTEPFSGQLPGGGDPIGQEHESGAAGSEQLIGMLDGDPTPGPTLAPPPADHGGYARPGAVADTDAIEDGERTDTLSEYPDDPIGSPDEEELFGWAGATADGEGSGQGDADSAGAGARSDLALGAAELLEQLARAVRAGELVLPAVGWPQTPPMVLAAVLTALLAREGRRVRNRSDEPAGP